MKRRTKLMATVLGVAAAGYYFYSSKHAKKHRQIAAKWATDMKNDVLKAARKAKNIDRKTLEGIIGNVAKTYHNLKNVNRRELARGARELKANWRQVMKEVEKGASAARKTVKRAVKNVRT